MKVLILKSALLDSKQVEILNFLRGLSALIVLLAHCQQIFINPYWYPHKNLDVDLVWVLYRHLGSFAVMIFFVLSGFLIYLSICRNIESSQNNIFNLKKFTVSRLVRLYPPLILSLIFTVLVYGIIQWLGLTGQKDFSVGHEIYFARPQITLDLKNILGSLLYLNTMVSEIKTPLLNGPLWSIAHEFWYYVVAGLFIFSLNKKKGWLGLIVIGYCLYINANEFWFYGLGVWISGAYAAWVFSNWQFLGVRVFNNLGIIITGILWLFMLLYSDSSYFINNRQKFMFGIFLAFLFPVILNSKIISFNIIELSICKLLRKLAPFAYSLYLLHFPFLLLVFVVFNKVTAGSPTLLLLQVVLSSSAIIYISYLVGKKVESTEFRSLIASFFYSTHKDHA